MYNHPALRLCLTLLLSLFLLGPQVFASPLEALPVQTKTPTNQLQKRGVLDDLWKSVTDPDKIINTGAAKGWMLDPSKSAAFAPTLFYGCTIVVIVNGKGVVIGHFAEVKPNAGACLNDAASVKAIIDKLETAEAFVDIENVDGTRAWIVYSNDIPTSSPGYRAIFANLNDPNGLNIPADNIEGFPYTRGNGAGDSGKIVVEWQSNDDGSGATLKVYIRQNSPRFTGNYDCNGNPVTGGSGQLKARAACGGQGPVTVTVVPVPIPQPTLCTYIPVEPPVINQAFCSCSGASYVLSEIPGSPVPVSSSCDYTVMPTVKATGINGFPPFTDLGGCEVCTPYAANGADCTTIPNCTPTPTPIL